MDDELILRRGISVADAIEILTGLLFDVRNIANGGGHFSELVNGYLMWVENAERQLLSLFPSSSIWRNLYTDRYWRIRVIDTQGDTRPMPLIQSEARWQEIQFESVLEDLRGKQQTFHLDSECAVVVPDTNVLAHYRRYDEIDWLRLSESKEVRLIIPLLVIDELDELSYKSQDGGQRASKVLRSLQRLREGFGPEQPIEVRPGITYQLLMDRPRHERSSNSDDEFLSRAEYLSTMIETKLFIATGDYGMRLRAEARDLTCLPLADSLRIPGKQVPEKTTQPTSDS
jgi:PIN domain